MNAFRADLVAASVLLSTVQYLWLSDAFSATSRSAGGAIGGAKGQRVS